MSPLDSDRADTVERQEVAEDPRTGRVVQRVGKWPTPSITSNRLLGMASWASWGWEMGMIRSRSPHTMSVGIPDPPGEQRVVVSEELHHG